MNRALCLLIAPTGSTMEKTLIFKELAVVLAVEDQDARVISPEFLSQTGIVNKDWEMAAKPILSEQGALIRYKNGYAIATTPKQFQLVQPFDGKPMGVHVPNMALRYCEILNSLTYRAVGINFRSLLQITDESQSTNQYILNLINSSNLKTQPSKATLNFVYNFNRNNLNLTIQDAFVSGKAENGKTPSVVFTGNCETRLQPDSDEALLDQLRYALNAWETDFAKYTTIVTDFLR